MSAHEALCQRVEDICTVSSCGFSLRRARRGTKTRGTKEEAEEGQEEEEEGDQEDEEDEEEDVQGSMEGEASSSKGKSTKKGISRSGRLR